MFVIIISDAVAEYSNSVIVKLIKFEIRFEITPSEASMHCRARATETFQTILVRTYDVHSILLGLIMRQCWHSNLPNENQESSRRMSTFI